MNKMSVRETIQIAEDAKEAGCEHATLSVGDFIDLADRYADLLEALEDLLEAEGVLSISVAERKARLAIAKAKGEGK